MPAPMGPGCGVFLRRMRRFANRAQLNGWATPPSPTEIPEPPRPAFPKMVLAQNTRTRFRSARWVNGPPRGWSAGAWITTAPAPQRERFRPPQIHPPENHRRPKPRTPQMVAGMVSRFISGRFLTNEGQLDSLQNLSIRQRSRWQSPQPRLNKLPRKELGDIDLRK